MEGPKRLRAVVLHEKYPLDLRVEAAMSLIRMKPRRGQRIGIRLLVERTLAELSAETRSQILAKLVPLIMAELRRPVPEAPPGDDKKERDPSFKYKDAAYLMLTYERTTVIADTALRKELEKALTEWAMADFERRLNDRSQDYGMKQLLRYIGSSSVRGLPELMTRDAKSLSTMAQLVAKLGDDETKEKASQKLVDVASYVTSPAWRKDREPELKEANRRAQIEPNEEQFTKQMERYQEESLLRIFGSMKMVGGKAVVEHCLQLAADDKASPKRRQAALAALEGHVKRNDTEHIDRLLGLVSKEGIPDLVLDQAFRRLRELPRDRVVDKLYDLFKVKRWKVRRAAGATVLQMSMVEHIEEFMGQLGKKAKDNFALPEAITYGGYLAELKGGDVRAALEEHMKRGEPQSRLSALAYYYSAGTAEDLPKLRPFEDDGEKVPSCDEDVDCGWQCAVQKGDDPKARELKAVKTVGDFVRFCIEPKMAARKHQDDKDSDKGKKKDDPLIPNGGSSDERPEQD